MEEKPRTRVRNPKALVNFSRPIKLHRMIDVNEI